MREMVRFFFNPFKISFLCSRREIIFKKKVERDKKNGRSTCSLLQVWDEELARVSQRWADQCMPGHDQRRNLGERLEADAGLCYREIRVIFLVLDCL